MMPFWTSDCGDINAGEGRRVFRKGKVLEEGSSKGEGIPRKKGEPPWSHAGGL